MFTKELDKTSLILPPCKTHILKPKNWGLVEMMFLFNWILSFMLVFRISWSFFMIWQYQPLESNPLPRIGQGSLDDPYWRNETMLHVYSIFLEVLHVAKRIVWVGNFQIHLSHETATIIMTGRPPPTPRRTPPSNKRLYDQGLLLFGFP